MVFENFKQLTEGKATITVKGHTEEVKLLTVAEKEKYDSLTNEGFGTIQANLGRNTTQKANMNIQKVTEAHNKADHYLIKTTFKESNISEEDINELYDVYPILVKELKRVNNIIDTDDEQVIEALQNKTEQNLKK